MAAGNRNSDDTPPVGELRQIRVDDITRNERNPRQTFNQDRIEKLAASLEEIGLQVPITVYANSSRSGSPYTLLDGERRFKAAKLINWTTIPAIVVAKPSAKQNAVRMFNIHMLREEWDEIETAWALESIIKETGIDSDRELQKLTGLSIDRIRNMKRVLSFPQRYQEMVAKGDLPYQLLVELDKNLLSRKRSESSDGREPILDMSSTQLRDVFLKKYIDNIETDVVDLRKVGTLYDTAVGDGRVAERAKAALTKLVSNADATIEEAYEEGAASNVELSKILRDIAALPGRISDLLQGRLERNQKQEVLAALNQLRSAVVDLIARVKRQ